MPSDFQLSFRLEADDDLKEMLPNWWWEFLTKPGHSEDEIVIRIEVNDCLNEMVCTNGWSSCELNGQNCAVFAPKGKLDFSLMYDQSLRKVTVYVRRSLDSFVRSGIQFGMLTALSGTCIGLHGVTLQCEGETIILSAPSGTGKTTLSNLLVKHFDTRVINGDFALLSVNEGGVYFEPTPFCGTSRICLNERARIDRIVFLSQSKENIWRELSGRQSIKCLMSNAFIPEFDGQLRLNVQGNIARILKNVHATEYSFAPTRAAARLFHERILLG